MRTAFVPLSLSLVLFSTTYAQTPDAWARVQQLAPGTSVKVSARGGGTCTVQSVSVDSLVCAHGSSTRSIARSDIMSVKLARRGHSALVGLALGAGIGAGAGVGIGTAVNSSTKGDFIHTSTAKSAGLGAAVGVLVGGTTGSAIGYSADLFAGPVIYKR